LNSKAKGNRFEREIAQELTEWTGMKMVRTPMSGAWSGCDVDIWPDSQAMYFPFAVECKKSEGWDLSGVLTGGALFQDWWTQAVTQAMRLSEKDGRKFHPMLFFARNRYPVMVCFDYYLFGPEEGMVSQILCRKYVGESGLKPFSIVPHIVSSLSPPCVIFPWEAFRDWLSYAEVKIALDHAKVGRVQSWYPESLYWFE